MSVDSPGPHRARTATWGLVLTGLVAAVIGAGCGDDRAAEPPNLLVVLADTLRADRLGSYGSTRGLTPFLDELAGRGVVFANAYSATSWTIPAVASLFTSRYPSQHRMVDFGSVLDAGEVTFPERLAPLGYRSLGVSANFRLEDRFGFGQGFDRWVIPPGARRHRGPLESRKVRADRVGDEALRILDAPGPVFLYLHFMEPHPPFLPPEPYRSVFGKGDPQSQLAANRKLIDPDDPFGDTLDDADLELLFSLYDGEVAAFDAGLRALFAKLERRGFLEDCVVVITSDHGEEFGEHRLQGHGFTLYEDSVRIPLVFLLPGDPGGRVVTDLVSLVDVAPTLLDLVQLPAEARFEGRSLAPLLRAGSRTPNRGQLIAELVDENEVSYRLHTGMLIRDSVKLLVDRNGNEEIFDLAADPGELEAPAEPLAGRRAELRRALETRTAELAESANRDAVTRDLDEETREGLRALGYGVE